MGLFDGALNQLEGVVKRKVQGEIEGVTRPAPPTSASPPEQPTAENNGYAPLTEEIVIRSHGGSQQRVNTFARQMEAVTGVQGVIKQDGTVSYEKLTEAVRAVTNPDAAHPKYAKDGPNTDLVSNNDIEYSELTKGTGNMAWDKMDGFANREANKLVQQKRSSLPDHDHAALNVALKDVNLAGLGAPMEHHGGAITPAAIASGGVRSASQERC